MNKKMKPPENEGISFVITSKWTKGTVPKKMRTDIDKKIAKNSQKTCTMHILWYNDHSNYKIIMN